MGKFNYAAAIRRLGASYLGNTKHSAKMKYSFNAGTLTYCVYLAPWNISGYQVCANGQHCHEHCLNGSGLSKVDIMSKGWDCSVIKRARIRRTRLFFEDRQLFMEILIYEIERAMKKAEELGLDFSIRINGTSDLSLEMFELNGKNILELYPNVQFYDYTKVYSRTALMEKYGNYDLTFSYDGYNWSKCEEFLKNGGKVAVVFDGKLPDEFNGYRVIDANTYDMRYIDPAGTICGLEYHRTANDYKTGFYKRPDTKFVVRTA